jgi:hypothetical protein
MCPVIRNDAEVAIGRLPERIGATILPAKVVFLQLSTEIRRFFREFASPPFRISAIPV